MKILIVKDNLDLSLNIAESPTRWGHGAEHVMRGEDALKKKRDVFRSCAHIFYPIARFISSSHNSDKYGLK